MMVVIGGGSYGQAMKMASVMSYQPSRDDDGDDDDEGDDDDDDNEDEGQDHDDLVTSGDGAQDAPPKEYTPPKKRKAPAIRNQPTRPTYRPKGRELWEVFHDYSLAEGELPPPDKLNRMILTTLLPLKSTSKILILTRGFSHYVFSFLEANLFIS